MECWICGRDADVSRLDMATNLGEKKERSARRTWYRCYCTTCLEEYREMVAAEDAEYVRLKKRRMFRRALTTLETQNADMYKYKEAIEVVEDALTEDLDKFDSSYEMLAAIILVQNRMYAKTQYKIGDYQVDFYLPGEQVVLEIDGDRHRHKRDHDAIRDEYIRRTLGRPWEVVRIATELLDKSAERLPEMIEKVLDYRSTGKVNWREIYK